MEEILIISNYYPPEKGAAANRIEQLALKLHEKKYAVTVLCPLANYPKGAIFPQYKGKFFVEETLRDIAVKRLWIFPSNSSGLVVRIFSVLSFSFGLFFYLLFKRTPKKVVVQSPPLLLAFISILVLSFKRKKIILNVSDLWPLAALELSVLQPNSFSHKVSLFFERFIYKKSTLVLGQSDEILEHVKKINPNIACHLYRNYPDHQLPRIDFKATEGTPIKVFYAGLLGVAQGVLEVCEKLELGHLDIEFHIFGEGAEKLRIENFIKSNPSKKIFFHGMIERSDLLLKLASFDIALVPLKTRIYGSVPSKIFEYSSLGIPVLYIGGGEGEKIVEENGLGWTVEVENFEGLNTALRQISMIDRLELTSMKKKIFEHSKTKFNLNLQIEKLIRNKVF